MIHVHRYHEIACGHRVVGHESKCRHLHGHNYRIHFSLAPRDGLDTLGRVLDFGVIKSVLCEWLESQWDHRLLLWENDPWGNTLRELDPAVVFLPFNPTAENMAQHLLERVAPSLLQGHEVVCTGVRVEETTKCHASAEL